MARRARRFVRRPAASASIPCILGVLSGSTHLAGGAWTFSKVGHDPTSQTEFTVKGVGAGAFDPSKIANWVHDARAPLIAPNTGGSCPGNIYAANAVVNGGAVNVYFGGWDGVSSCHDSVSVAVTEDDFTTINPHAPVVATGSMVHVNNPSALKRPDGEWAIMYTQLVPGVNLNKPGFSTSADGVTWSPAAGGASQLVQMNGYEGWELADVNGGNVIVYADGAGNGNGNGSDAGEYHMYFCNFKNESQHAVFHAVAPAPATAAAAAAVGGKEWRDAPPPPLQFTYSGVALDQPSLVPTDVKLINGHWVMGLHMNSQQTYFSVVEAANELRHDDDDDTSGVGKPQQDSGRGFPSHPVAGVNSDARARSKTKHNGNLTSSNKASSSSSSSSSSSARAAPPDSFPPAKVLFEHLDTADNYIVSIGFVVDESSSTLRGALYGAGAVPQLDNNRVFAAWLQRRVLFISSNGTVIWGAGDAARSMGPDAVQLGTDAPALTGHFFVYDADFVDTTTPGTLLGTSQEVTVSPGDIWQMSSSEA